MSKKIFGEGPGRQLTFFYEFLGAILIYNKINTGGKLDSYLRDR